jgi:hypothetical protein
MRSLRNNYALHVYHDTIPSCDVINCTVVSRVSTHGRLNITHNFGMHGCLPQDMTFVTLCMGSGCLPGIWYTQIFPLRLTLLSVQLLVIVNLSAIRHAQCSFATWAWRIQLAGNQHLYIS